MFVVTTINVLPPSAVRWHPCVFTGCGWYRNQLPGDEGKQQLIETFHKTSFLTCTHSIEFVLAKVAFKCQLCCLIEFVLDKHCHQLRNATNLPPAVILCSKWFEVLKTRRTLKVCLRTALYLVVTSLLILTYDITLATSLIYMTVLV